MTTEYKIVFHKKKRRNNIYSIATRKKPTFMDLWEVFSHQLLDIEAKLTEERLDSSWMLPNKSGDETSTERLGKLFKK